MLEEYHQARKTGGGIEQPQFTRTARLEPVIALLSVVAVLLLNLRDYRRQPSSATTPARTVVPEADVAVLSVWRYRARRPSRLAGVVARWGETPGQGGLCGGRRRGTFASSEVRN